jgi:hypothetical protein
MKLGGSGDDRNGRMTFSTSLSRIRAAIAAEEARSNLGLSPEKPLPPAKHFARRGLDFWIEGSYSYFGYDAQLENISGRFGLA